MSGNVTAMNYITDTVFSAYFDRRVVVSISNNRSVKCDFVRVENDFRVQIEKRHYARLICVTFIYIGLICCSYLIDA
jgi:predicted acetyltransferase